MSVFSLICFFHHGGSDHIETSPLICRVNQWTGFYMIGTSVMKEVRSPRYFPEFALKYQGH